ncbi:MAG: hypothetical protein ABSG21_14960 [Spirochaetia bacterium]|jgi:hypothetical protein
MRFDKTVIHRMNMPYAIGTLGTGPNPSVACATEDHGPVVLIEPPYRQARTLVPGPGGCMALVADPEQPGELYAVMGCFLGYKFQGGGVYHIREGSPAVRVLDLPFAHRIGIVTRGGARYLLAANLAEDKKDAADWSLPGAVYAAELGGDDGASVLTAQPVLTGMHKNHGFLLTDFEGRRTLLIGAAEGVFAVDLDSPGKAWSSRQVLARETSEMAMFDLDGDGADELVTIEPFHGNVLRAYKKTAGGWHAFWDSELSFGHCVLAGMFQGQRSIFVSNRAGNKSLLLFQFSADASTPPRKIVVDEGAGAANMLVLPQAGGDLLFAANQAAGEIAVYGTRPESD